MLPSRIDRIRELSTVLKWLRHRHSIQIATRDKFQKLYVENPTQISQAMFTMYDKRSRVIHWLITTVELDLKTLASNGKAEGTKGARKK